MPDGHSSLVRLRETFAGLSIEKGYKGMTEARKDAPRRYIVNGAGQRVLVGLTNSETIEFERLDKPQVEFNEVSVPDQARLEEYRPGRNASEQRWLELYGKHERAWSVWMAKSRAPLHPHVAQLVGKAGISRVPGRSFIPRACCFPECSSK